MAGSGQKVLRPWQAMKAAGPQAESHVVGERLRQKGMPCRVKLDVNIYLGGYGKKGEKGEEQRRGREREKQSGERGEIGRSDRQKLSLREREMERMGSGYRP